VCSPLSYGNCTYEVGLFANLPDLFTTFSATPITEAVQFVIDDVRCHKAFVDDESSTTTFR